MAHLPSLPSVPDAEPPIQPSLYTACQLELGVTHHAAAVELRTLADSLETDLHASTSMPSEAALRVRRGSDAHHPVLTGYFFKEGMESFTNGNVRLLKHERSIVAEDDLDRRSQEATTEAVSKVIFLCKHTAVSNCPALTVHPIGVPHLREDETPPQGGRPGWATVPNPLIGPCLRLMQKVAAYQGLVPEFEETVEEGLGLVVKRLIIHHYMLVHRDPVLCEALEFNWHALLEDIGLWISAEVPHTDHDNNPANEPEEEEIIAGPPLRPQCNTELHADYGGAVVKWGLMHHKESAADCCQACLDQARNAKPAIEDYLKDALAKEHTSTEMPLRKIDFAAGRVGTGSLVLPANRARVFGGGFGCDFLLPSLQIALVCGAPADGCDGFGCRHGAPAASAGHASQSYAEPVEPKQSTGRRSRPKREGCGEQDPSPQVAAKVPRKAAKVEPKERKPMPVVAPEPVPSADLTGAAAVEDDALGTGKSAKLRVKETLRAFNSHYLHLVQEEQKRAQAVIQEIQAKGAAKNKKEYENFTSPWQLVSSCQGYMKMIWTRLLKLFITGQGGNDLLGTHRQIGSQQLSRGNLALKVVDDWVQKGVQGHVVYKSKLKRIEGAIHSCGRSRKISELPGQENIPIPATNVVDDPPVPPSGWWSPKQLFECGANCSCNRNCVNRTSQQGLQHRLEVFKTASKGWGVRTWDTILPGLQSVNTVGVLRRTEEVDEKCRVDMNMPSLHAENDSEAPPAPEMRLLTNHHDVKLAKVMLFAADTILPLQELCYDYGYVLNSVVSADGEIVKLPCYCGAPDCRKRLY
ncbi:D-aminoacyl-tRNA deacylase [Hordeum vulgare]|nr:D-aminoacyl-tRNA deacylase [Hordeum vulgare]